MQARSLETEAQYLKGVGPRNAPALAKIGLRTVGDVLRHIPRRYEDRRHLPPIRQVRGGQWATIRGRVLRIETRPTRGGRVLLKAAVSDGTGTILLTWFNQPWIKRQLEAHKGEIVAYGLAKEAEHLCEINNAEFELLGDEDDPDDFAQIVPVYPSTEGLSQKTLRKAARAAVEQYLEHIEDPLPPRLLKERRLSSLKWALRQIHQPTSEEERLEARRRLVFEEFFYLQLALALRRAETQQEMGIAFPIQRLLKGEPVLSSYGAGGGRAPSSKVQDGKAVAGHLFVAEQRERHDGEPLWDQVSRMLPFELTGAQRRVIEEIWLDMERPSPMNRLVQGDVGSGKTAVAAAAMLAAVRSGYQAALMAPTEILAEQHWVNLHCLFDPLGLEVVLLVGKQSASQKKKATAKAASGTAQIAIGTHALIQEGVEFARLGFVVIDEQHRFGVLQRAALRQKGLGNPDVLVMTATPIPRTLTMTLYGDLDLSVIDELPPGRKPVRTHWKQPFERGSVYEGVRKLIQEGRQAYFVCPMVSESEKMQAQAAEDLHYRLVSGAFKDLRVGLLHGQMKPSEKELTMEAFRRHELDVLVSTTVIEVGVDVPNASAMVIEDANRFGLSQLHQLRGRVGRSAAQSYCVMIADARTDDAQARMEVMVGTTDGFKIAEADLRLRGPGQMVGTAQSGFGDFKVADLIQDGRMLEEAREAALAIVAQDPRLDDPSHQRLRSRLSEARAEMAVVALS